MRFIRSVKNHLVHLILCTCSVTIVFMYIFQCRQFSTCCLFDCAGERRNISTTNYRHKNTNDFKDIEKNFRKLIFLPRKAIDMNRFGINGSMNPQILADILGNKLKSINLTIEMNKFKPTCENDTTRANSCHNNKCLQTELPENLTTRVEQLVVPRGLKMSAQEHEILREMANKVIGSYDVILLTATSSNHFAESQGLIKSLHENVYPYLKNFTHIFYNLGLTERERSLMVKYCKCQVKDFPFHKFPQFMTSLTCYTWKPVLIKAHLQKANIVFWMDTSVRFHNSSTKLTKLIQATRERGVQIIGASADSTFRTDRSMYHFFGDEPCAYLTLGQAEAGFGVYHREYFVDRAILEPWVACALNNDCMCLKRKSQIDCSYSNRVAGDYYKKKGPLVYDLCHRFDQSAISLILHKLYQEAHQWVMLDLSSVLEVRRDHIVNYFVGKA